MLVFGGNMFLEYIFLAAVVVGTTVQNVTRKSFNSKARGGAFTFSAAATLFALLVFVVTSGGRFEFNLSIVPYALIFAVAYIATAVFMLLAIKEGSLALTSLIIQYSLIMPTVFGFALLGEEVGVFLIVGIVLLLVSLALINLEGKSDKKTVTPRWLIYVILSFLGNGLCSTSQKAQQIYYDGQYKNEFMIVALSISFVFMLFAALITERKDMLHNLKVGVPTYSICGLTNGLVNFLVLVLSTKMPASVMFPVISAGGIVTTYFVSLFIYKEKMSVRQTVGLFVGIASIIALNL
jgi:drug/metabolite transporter (DMT)-like permease